MNLHGNVVGNPVPRPDWAQNSRTAPDYIKNKPNVEGLVNTCLPKAGGTMTGTVNMGFHYITNLSANPLEDHYAVRKDYVDRAEARATAAANNAATAAGNAQSTADAALPKAGGTLSGDLKLGDGTNTTQHDLYIRRTVGSAPKSGRLYWGSTGNLRLQAASNESPFNALELRPDSTEFDKPVSVESGGTGATKATDALDNLGGLSKKGGTMTGAIDMGSKKISNLAAPTNNADAATKSYVDGKVAGARLYGTVSLTTSWTNGAQEIGVEGILATDMPHWGIVYGTNREAEKDAFALVDELETSAGKFTFRCFGDVPAVALNIQWEVNR